jgi:hypothetical protein
MWNLATFLSKACKNCWLSFIFCNIRAANVRFSVRLQRIINHLKHKFRKHAILISWTKHCEVSILEFQVPDCCQCITVM